MSKDYYTDYYQALVGRRVEAVVKSEDFHGLLFDNGVIGWIQQDPEGNGPGHLELQKPSTEET